MGRVFRLVFPVLNLEIQKFGPKKSRFFLGIFFRMPKHRHQRHLWLGSGRHFDETKSLSFANRDAMAGFNMFFVLKTHLNLPSKQFLFEIFVCFFETKIRLKIHMSNCFPIKNKCFWLKQSKIRCLPFTFMP